MGLVVCLLVGLTALVFGSTLAYLTRRGGQVQVSHFGLPDLLTGGTLACFFIGVMVQSISGQSGPPAPPSIDQLLPGQVLVLAIVASLASFLIYRHLNPARVFGFTRLSLGGTIGCAVVFLLAALPVVGLTNQLTMLMLRDLATEQDLVGLFRKLSRENDLEAIGKAFLATVILAPACEEFLFRGYFYGVGKRYLGGLGSALAVSLLFAAFHLNLAALPGLFVLALCLTAAYERTGSLFVPIGMHAIYNCTSLVILYLQAQGKLSGFPS